MLLIKSRTTFNRMSSFIKSNYYSIFIIFFSKNIFLILGYGTKSSFSFYCDFVLLIQIMNILTHSII